MPVQKTACRAAVGRVELRSTVSDIKGMLRHAFALMHAPYILVKRLDDFIFREEISGTRRIMD